MNACRDSTVPGQLKLACPRCGQAARLTWESLQRRLFCRRCRQWYRLDRTGLAAAAAPREPIDVAVRSGFSAWRLHQVTWPGVREAISAAGGRRWLRRLAAVRPSPRRAILGLLILLAASAAGLAAWRSGSRADPLQAALPDALEERVPRLSAAWLQQDVRGMLRLVEPSRDRELRRWLARNPPPAESDCRRLADAEVVVVSVRRAARDGAEVTVRIRLSPPDAPEQSVSQKQEWTCRGGVWYFVPPVMAASRRV